MDPIPTTRANAPTGAALPTPPVQRARGREGGTTIPTSEGGGPGDHGHPAAETVLQAKGLLQSVEIVGIVDRGEGGSIERAVFAHDLTGHLSGVRHLFGEHYQAHEVSGRTEAERFMVREYILLAERPAPTGRPR